MTQIHRYKPSLIHIFKMGKRNEDTVTFVQGKVTSYRYLDDQKIKNKFPKFFIQDIARYLDNIPIKNLAKLWYRFTDTSLH